MESLRTVAGAGALALLVVSGAGPRAVAAGTVRTVTTAADSADAPPEGSLRKILESVAQPGDTIRFAQNFSISIDTRHRIEIPVALTGIALEGPAELRAGVLVVRGDDATIAGLRFTDCRVFAGSQESFDDGSRTDRFVFHDNVLVNDSGLQMILTADAVVRDNTFDVREPRGDNCVGDAWSEQSRWTHNTWTDLSRGGFTENNSTDLLFDGGNRVVGNAIFEPRSGRIAGNVVTGNLRAYHSDSGIVGALTIEENECGTLSASRPDLEILGNTITGDPEGRAKKAKFTSVVQDPAGQNVATTRKELLVTPFSVGMGQIAGDAGYLVVQDNVVDATAGWISGMLVRATADATYCRVEGNTVEGGKTASLSVYVAKSAAVTANTVKAGARKGALVLGGTATEGFTVEGNVVEDGLGSGIVIAAGEGAAALSGNTVKNCRGIALQSTGREIVSTNDTLRDNGTGAKVGKNTTASFHGGTVTGNVGVGIYADAGASVEVSRVVFGGNGGAGIDLAPGGVSVNAKRKSANGNMPFPESLEFDAGTGRVKGRAEALARVDAYAVEEGPRAGNPSNGEGVSWLGEVVAGSDGRFTWPATGRAPCPPSNRITFTATRVGGGDPVTSEFSDDVGCAGASLALIDQAPDGTPANLRSDSVSSVLPAHHRTVSEDGRWVVFNSRATNLVEGDTNGVVDVFLRDTVLGTTTRVNRTPSGGQVTYAASPQPDAGSAPSISADGRWIAYTSRAEGSFTDGAWYYNDPGVILHDALTGTNTIVASPVQQAGPLPSGSWSYGGAYWASISGDGSAVVFVARGPDYVSGDAGDDVDVFLWTRATGAVERVSVPTGGGDPTNGWQSSVAGDPRLSHDARFAVFGTSQDLSGGALGYNHRIWIRDRQAGVTEAVSVDAAGAARSGYDPWVSDDGRYVVFWTSDALVPADTNGFASVYLRDRQTDTTTLVSANPDGTAMYGDCLEPCLSGDGRWLAFRNFQTIWLLDRQENVRTNVSGSASTTAQGYCYRPRLSRTGRFLLFETDATNLTDLGGQSFVNHVYLRDLSVEAE